MKTHVEFRSDKFPACEGEEEQVNPGLWGKRLAEYLVEKLNSAGIATEEPIPEDWGWCIPVKNEAFPLFIGCGHQYGDADEFLGFVHPDKPTIRRWFKKIDTTAEVGRVADALEKILTADPEIREIRWQDGEKSDD
jgi:hypothetical protein